MPTLPERSETDDASVLPLTVWPSHMCIMWFAFRIAHFVFLHPVVATRVLSDTRPAWLASLLAYAFVLARGFKLRGLCLSLLFSYRPMFR